MQKAKDSMFVLVEASRLSLDDEFMKYEPITNNQREFKKLLTEAINSGLSDFWRPKLDPSFNEERNGLVFEAGKKPAVGKSYDWWKKTAKNYLHERGSRLGTKKEYVAFLGILIKGLVASGWPVYYAWRAVCDDSKKLGHYCNSENAKQDFELTGSREICGLCDLANTSKILAGDEESGDDFWLAGGYYILDSKTFPLAHIAHYPFQIFKVGNRGVGWLVLSK